MGNEMLEIVNNSPLEPTHTKKGTKDLILPAALKHLLEATTRGSQVG